MMINYMMKKKIRCYYFAIFRGSLRWNSFANLAELRVRTFCLYFKHSNQKIALKNTHFVKPCLFKLKRGLVEDSYFGVSYSIMFAWVLLYVKWSEQTYPTDYTFFRCVDNWSHIDHWNVWKQLRHFATLQKGKLKFVFCMLIYFGLLKF